MPSRESRRSHAGLLVDNIVPMLALLLDGTRSMVTTRLSGCLIRTAFWLMTVPFRTSHGNAFFDLRSLGFLDDIETRGTDQVSYVC